MEDTKGHDVHTRAYSCTECDKSFEWPDSLRKHRKREHPANGERPMPYACPECGREYKWLESLRNHRKVKHPFNLGRDSSPFRHARASRQHQGARESFGEASDLDSLFESKQSKDEFGLLDLAEDGSTDPFGQPPDRLRKRPRSDVEGVGLTASQQAQLQSRVLSDRLRYKAERDEARARNLELLEERDDLKVRLKLEKGKSEDEIEELKRRCGALEQERNAYKAQLESRGGGIQPGAQDYRVTLAYGYLCEATAQIESATEMILNLGQGAQGSEGPTG